MERSLKAEIQQPEDVCRIDYTTCDGRFKIIACDLDGENWYLIADLNNPYRQRWVRLFKASGLSTLVKAYGYIDSKGCLNKDTGIIHRGVKIAVPTWSLPYRLSRELRGVQGVPQRSRRSGSCWYCAMCFVMLFSPQMRHLFEKKAPSLWNIMKDVLTNHDMAEKLRCKLYYEYALGDRPGQDPSKDGQNGFKELCILLARLDIPTVRLFAPGMHQLNDGVRDQQQQTHTLRIKPRANETSLLVVRTFRTKWTPRPRIRHNGRRYKLIAAMIGSEHCGHQIGASAIDIRRCSTWALSDSDATMYDVGPMYWSVPRKKDEPVRTYLRRWRSMWTDMFPATLFAGEQVCDMNPTNRPTHELQNHGRAIDDDPSTAGVVNTDYIYMHIP